MQSPEPSEKKLTPNALGAAVTTFLPTCTYVPCRTKRVHTSTFFYDAVNFPGAANYTSPVQSLVCLEVAASCIDLLDWCVIDLSSHVQTYIQSREADRNTCMSRGRQQHINCVLHSVCCRSRSVAWSQQPHISTLLVMAPLSTRKCFSSPTSATLLAVAVGISSRSEATLWLVCGTYSL